MRMTRAMLTLMAAAVIFVGAVAPASADIRVARYVGTWMRDPLEIPRSLFRPEACAGSGAGGVCFSDFGEAMYADLEVNDTTACPIGGWSVIHYSWPNGQKFYSSGYWCMGVQAWLRPSDGKGGRARTDAIQLFIDGNSPHNGRCAGAVPENGISFSGEVTLNLR